MIRNNNQNRPQSRLEIRIGEKSTKRITSIIENYKATKY